MTLQITELSDADTFSKLISIHHKIENMPEDAYDPLVFDAIECLILASYGLQVVFEEHPDAYASMATFYGVDDLGTLAGLIVKMAADGDEDSQDIADNLVLEGANYFASLSPDDLPEIRTLH